MRAAGIKDYGHLFKDRKFSKYFPRDYVLNFISSLGKNRILELGCGDGKMAVELATLGNRVTGYDISNELVEIAKKRANVNDVKNVTHFEIEDVDNIEKFSQYNVILSYGFLHHVDFRKIINNISNNANKGTYVIFAEPVDLSPRFNSFIRKIFKSERLISDNENPLSISDYKFLSTKFKIIDDIGFNLFSRLSRLFKGDLKLIKKYLIPLYLIDLILNRVRFLKKFYRVRIIIGKTQ